MTGARPIYSVLLVSAAKKINTALMPFFPPERFEPVTVADSAARARRILADRDYDLVIINAPLPDEFGRKLAVDVCIDSERVALLLVRSDMYDEIRSVMSAHGVLVTKRPMERSVFKQLLDSMCLQAASGFHVQRPGETAGHAEKDHDPGGKDGRDPPGEQSQVGPHRIPQHE